MSNLIQRATTKSGSVYDFKWDRPYPPTHGARPGRVRKNGGEWEPCFVITLWWEPGGRIFYTLLDDTYVHTTRIVSSEKLLE